MLGHPYNKHRKLQMSHQLPNESESLEGRKQLLIWVGILHTLKNSARSDFHEVDIKAFQTLLRDVFKYAKAYKGTDPVLLNGFQDVLSDASLFKSFYPTLEEDANIP